MADHTFYKCEPECDGCMFCRGGLLSCVVCGCAEGELPTDCPGYKVSEAERLRIYKGNLDFINEEWTTR